MSGSATYPPRTIGLITRPTPEQRAREGDRWVALRTLQTASTAPIALPAPTQINESRNRALFHAIDQRHAEARRKLAR